MTSRLMFEQQHGVAVAINGSLHTCFHVTEGSGIWLDGEILLPYVSDALHDTIVYGGKWQINQQVTENVTAALTYNGKMTPTLCPTGVATTPTEEFRYVNIDGPKGCSGSPIYNSRKEVCGLFGFGFNYKGYNSIILNRLDHGGLDDDIQDDDYEISEEDKVEVSCDQVEKRYIDWHPGKGKTRKVIVSMAEQATKQRRRCVVLVPTRVVRDEVLDALRAKKVLAGTGRKSLSSNLVSVLCHSHFFDLCLKEKSLVRKSRLYIMDEAHFLDPKSIALRGVLEDSYLAGRCSLYLLTATPPGYEGLCGSNYPIEDVPMKDFRVEKLIQDRNVGGAKILIYVDSKSLADSWAKKFHGVSLHRGNFDKNYSIAKKMDKGLIFSTDITELGANLNVDVVIDPRTSIKPYQCEDQVVLRKGPINGASVNQRRGRVGRTKPGTYIYDQTVDVSYDEEPVCWEEAAMLMAQIGVVGLEEELKNFEIGKQYGLRGSQLEHFVRLVLSNSFDIPIWLAWQLAANNEIDTDWLVGGREQIEGKPCMPSGHFKGYIIAPKYFDARFFNASERGNLQNYIGASKNMRSSDGISLSTYSDIFTDFHGTADKVSYLYGNVENLDKRQLIKSIETAKLVIPFLVIATIICTLLLLTIFKWALRSSQASYHCPVRSTTDGSMSGISSLSSWVFMGLSSFYWEIPYPIFLGMGLLLIVLYPVLYSNSGFRSSQQEIITLVVIVSSALAFLAVMYELERIPRLESLVTSIFTTATPEPITRDYIYVPAITLDIHLPRTLAAYMAFCALFEGAVAAYNTHTCFKWLTSDKQREGKRELPGVGLSLRNIHWRTFLSCLPFFWGISTVELGIALTIASVFTGIHFVQDRFDQGLKATVAEAGRNARGGKIDLQELYNVEYTRASKIIYRLGVAAIVVILSLIGTMTGPDFIVCFLILPAALLEILVEGPAATFPLGVIIPFAEIFRHANIIVGMSSLIIHAAAQASSLRSSNTQIGSLATSWKKRLNQLDAKAFNDYKNWGVDQTPRGDYVSRGGLKMSSIISSTSFKARGHVVDLGCGRGGWSQRLCMEQPVKQISSYTLGGIMRENPQPFSTYGHNLIKFKPGCDVYTLEPVKADTIVCDIGESDANLYVEEKRTLRVLEVLENWLKANKGASFCCKVLSPGPIAVQRKLAFLQHTYGGMLFRCPQSRNSTAEMYFVSGKNQNIGHDISKLYLGLIKRFLKREESIIKEPPTLRCGTRRVETTLASWHLPHVQSRINKIREQFSRTWDHDPDNPYKTFYYHGSYATSARNPGGQAINSFIKKIMWPWERVYDVTRFMLTDVSSRAQQQILREKVDTRCDDCPPHLKMVNRSIMMWLAKLLKKRSPLKPRVLTPEDFMNNVRNDAAVGGWCEEIDWSTAEEAIHDPKFWKIVDRERELHLKGDCELCVYNTMGKKEKKPSTFGLAKGSRTIWYLWLGGRFLEYEALGFLNEDHWVSRKVLPSGVGGESVHYFGYHLKDIASRCSRFVADDVAGWDTRLTKNDLEDERAFIKALGLTKAHQNLVDSVYTLLYRSIVALFPRNSPLGGNAGTLMDVVSRDDQRGSGQVVTYSLNTITNTKVILGRCMESYGLDHVWNKHKDCQLCEDLNCGEINEVVSSWLETYGIGEMNNSVVAGDDSAHGSNDALFSKSIGYINETGKIRKDWPVVEPSRIITNWEDVSFCSHHFHQVHLKDGRELVVPCRDQNEVIGRARISKGAAPDFETAACQAKSYTQMWLIFFFHRRDLRLAALGVQDSVPKSWMPTGLTSWSIHQKHEWMTTENILTVWNKIWILNNPAMVDKTVVTSWRDIPYVHKKQDIDCGSLIGDKARASWAKQLPSIVQQIRNHFGYNDYNNELAQLGRYNMDTDSLF